MPVSNSAAEQAISVRNLSKSYRVWQHSRDMMAEVLSGKKRHRDYQALKDISFDVPKGSVVGLMGRNGAGKSTLLRIIAGTLDSTLGEARVQGRISAILELGSGFHPEYTGRENVFMGGMCLGMTRQEIVDRYDEIVKFTELEEFMEQPFRTYSSGMQARLTFAVATCIDPDVLIVDEALGVGDARFQLKCFDRIRSFKQQGKSILLVSHSIGQITAICDHALLLEKGRLIASGEPNSVANLYHELLFGDDERSAAEAIRTSSRVKEEMIAEDATSTLGGADSAVAGVDNRELRYGAREAEIIGTWLVDDAGRPVRTVKSLGEYAFVCRIRANKRFDQLAFGLHVRDIRGLELFGWDMEAAGLPPLPPMEAGEERNVALKFKANLNAGHYFISATLATYDRVKQDVRFDCHDLIVSSVPDVHHASLVNLNAVLDPDFSSAIGSVAQLKSNSMAWRFGLRLIGPFLLEPEGWSAQFARPVELAEHFRGELFLVADDALRGRATIVGGNRVIVAPADASRLLLERTVFHLVRGTLLDLSGAAHAVEGAAWKIQVKDLTHKADDEANSTKSVVYLFADDQQLGPPHALHAEISELGEGRFSHWGDSIIFSMRDNSDPNTAPHRLKMFIAEPLD